MEHQKSEREMTRCSLLSCNMQVEVFHHVIDNKEKAWDESIADRQIIGLLLKEMRAQERSGQWVLSR